MSDMSTDIQLPRYVVELGHLTHCVTIYDVQTIPHFLVESQQQSYSHADTVLYTCDGRDVSVCCYTYFSGWLHIDAVCDIIREHMADLLWIGGLTVYYFGAEKLLDTHEKIIECFRGVQMNDLRIVAHLPHSYISLLNYNIIVIIACCNSHDIHISADTLDACTSTVVVCRRLASLQLCKTCMQGIYNTTNPNIAALMTQNGTNVAVRTDIPQVNMNKNKRISLLSLCARQLEKIE